MFRRYISQTAAGQLLRRIVYLILYWPLPLVFVLQVIATNSTNSYVPFICCQMVFSPRLIFYGYLHTWCLSSRGTNVNLSSKYSHMVLEVPVSERNAILY